jgi:hypothetical protein
VASSPQRFWDWSVDDCSSLHRTLNHFDKLYRPESFAKIVEDEYKRFLVIKCVEKIASCKNLEDTASIWLWSAQPRKLVELVWHAHCLSTSKYCSDCNVIFGQVVEFTGLYDTHGEAPSTLEKHKILFQFERQFLKSSFPHYCGVPHITHRRWQVGGSHVTQQTFLCKNWYGTPLSEDTISRVDEGDCPRERTIVGDFAAPIAMVWWIILNSKILISKQPPGAFDLYICCLAWILL